MSPAEFKAWRRSLGLKQKEAAEKLGLRKRMIQYYERASPTAGRWRSRAPSASPAMR
jgi:transcriptional regulator with XRE-family HTH domain